MNSRPGTIGCGRCPGARPQAAGYVLVMVLFTLAMLALLASRVALVSQRAVGDARAELDGWEAELAQISTRETLLYLLVGQRRTFGGVTVDDQVVYSAGLAVAPGPGDDPLASLPPLPIGNEIRLDGHTYAGVDGTRFRLLDDLALISYNFAAPMYEVGLDRALGLRVGEGSRMRARLLDYQDPDDLVRIGGAEARRYRDADMPEPANRTLLTPLELRRVLGWKDVLNEWDDARILGFFTTAAKSGINVNTASAEVLQLLPGVDEALAQRLVALRQPMPFMLAWNFISEFGLPLAEENPFAFESTSSGLLYLWHNKGSAVQVLHWRLTPWDQERKPWRFDYQLTLPLDPDADDRQARSPQSALFATEASGGE